MSYVLKRIISGELVCIPGKRGRVKGGYQPGKAVIADHPVPLRMPLRWWYDMKAAGQDRANGGARPDSVVVQDALGQSAEVACPADGGGAAQMTMGRDVRREEVPEAVWEFCLWLRRYTKKRQITKRLTSTQYVEVAAEASRCGVTIDEDPQGRFLYIDFVKQ
jgi:hypothetical protein